MDPVLHQVCINTSEHIVGIVGSVVLFVSMFTNMVPAPDKITNPVLRFISRVLHFASADIVTAVK